jgi:hypothetical protein
MGNGAVGIDMTATVFFSVMFPMVNCWVAGCVPGFDFGPAKGRHWSCYGREYCFSVLSGWTWSDVFFLFLLLANAKARAGDCNLATVSSWSNELPSQMDFLHVYQFNNHQPLLAA